VIGSADYVFAGGTMGDAAGTASKDTSWHSHHYAMDLPALIEFLLSSEPPAGGEEGPPVVPEGSKHAWRELEPLPSSVGGSGCVALGLKV
jgi:hypothetical protein